jgi:hypothetical protein
MHSQYAGAVASRIGLTNLCVCVCVYARARVITNVCMCSHIHTNSHALTIRRRCCLAHRLLHEGKVRVSQHVHDLVGTRLQSGEPTLMSLHPGSAGAMYACVSVYVHVCVCVCV